MKHATKAVSPTRRGSIIMMTAFGMVFIIGLTAMVTDVGWMYYNKARLQSAVNAGWKAGYDLMMELGLPVASDSALLITTRVKDVMKQNGYTDADLNSVVVNFPNNNSIQVIDEKRIDMFFSRVFMASGTTNVDAYRGGPGDSGGGGVGIAPLAIPFAVVKDLDKSNYRIEFFDRNDPNSGFSEGMEYVLKLGSGDSDKPPSNNQTLILIAMDNQPDDDTYCKAYGAAYWCLRIVKVNANDDVNDKGFMFPPFTEKNGEILPGHEGIEWLLGHRGGSFLLPYDDGKGTVYSEIKNKLDAMGVTYEFVAGPTAISALYKAVGANILKIDKPRPRIAVYSSQDSADPVEVVMRIAQIPYGDHPQQRFGTFKESQCNHIYDGEIIDGELQKSVNGEALYTWLHCHHEDFTGWTGGCDNVAHSCNTWEVGGKGTISKTASTTTELCVYCRDYYFSPPGAGWGIYYDKTRCERRKKTKTNCWSYWKAGFTNDGDIDTNEICSVCVAFYNLDNTKWKTATSLPMSKSGKTYPTNYTSCWLNQSTPRTCMDWDGTRLLDKTASTSADLCPYCRWYYWYATADPGWEEPKKKIGYEDPKCENWGLRCAEKRTAVGTLWRNLSSYTTRICKNDSERPQCRSFQASWDTATAKGYTDAASYSNRLKLVDTAGNLIKPNGRAAGATTPYIAADSPFIKHPSRVQQMKWDVVSKIKKHVDDGGYLYAQCFAPETLAQALWQRKIYRADLTGADATAEAAYADCLGFKNFRNDAFFHSYNAPGASHGQRYTTINAHNDNSFTLNSTTDPRCQNHGTEPDCGTGHCDSFMKDTVKSAAEGTTILGDITSTITNYIKGTSGLGQFAFIGGHSHGNIYAKRLVLNNVLLGALAEKRIDDAPVIKQKSHYGIIDPDNTQGGGANDYRDRFMYGFNQPIEINDRINPETGNQVGPTDQAFDYRFLTANTRVIIPITDLGPEIAYSSKNASATCIYDLTGQDQSNGEYRNTATFTFEASVRIVGFAEFELVPVASYTRDGNSIVTGDTGDLGPSMSGQVRGKFIRYIVKPYELPLN
jgi:Flp pilus assembly protein TadG